MTIRYLSVCSGIEAATAAWHHLGWKPVGFSEIEPFPSAVLAHHYPGVKNYGDLTQYESWGLKPGDIDLIVGGTPCQAFSVAGLRGGLADARGNLALVFCRMVDHFRPRWVLWENVPGVLSSNGGRDFGSILGALADCGYGFAYRVLDAQFFGVPQRRRRVFLVGHLGDWEPAATVLLEPESLRGDSASSGEAGKAVAPDAAGGARGRRGKRGAGGNGGGDGERWPARVAPTLAANFGAKLGQDNRHALSGAGLFVPAAGFRMTAFGEYQDDDSASTLKMRDYKDATDLVTVPQLAGALDTQCGSGKLTHQTVVNGHVIAQPMGVDVYNGLVNGDVAATVVAAQGRQNGAGPHVAVPRTPSHWDDPSAPHPTLNQSSRGTGQVGYSNQEIFSQRGAYLVPATAQTFTAPAIGSFQEDNVAGTLTHHNGAGAGETQNAAFVAYGFYANEGSHGMGDNRDISPSMKIGSGTGAVPPAVAYGFDPTGSTVNTGEETAPTLRGAGAGGNAGHRAGVAYGQLPLAFAGAIPIQDGRDIQKAQNGLGIGSPGDPAYTLDTTGAQSVFSQPLAFAQNTREEVRLIGGDGQTTGTLNAQTGTHQTTYIAQPMPFDTNQITHRENRSNPQPGDPCPTLAVDTRPPAIAFSAKDYGAVAMAFDTYNQTATGDIAQTLCSRGDTPGGNAHLVPAVAVPMVNMQGSKSNAVAQEDGPSYTLNAMHGHDVHAVAVPRAFNVYPGRPGEDSPAELKACETEIANAVTVTEHAKSTDRGTRVVQPAIFDAYNQTVSDVSFPLRVGLGNGQGDEIPKVLAPTLTAANDPSRSPQSAEVTQQVAAVHATTMIVRRLTPVECERLQGFPDNFTKIPWKGKPADACPDGPRYKALGNSMAVPCMRWIGERIDRVERNLAGEAAEPK